MIGIERGFIMDTSARKSEVNRVDQGKKQICIQLGSIKAGSLGTCLEIVIDHRTKGADGSFYSAD